MKTVYLLHAYRGALTDEKMLPKGELTLNDDMADYLVENGHAVEVAAQQAPAEPTRGRKSRKTEELEPI